MKKYRFKISGQAYEVEVGPFDGVNATVSVNGTPYEVEIEGGDTLKSKTPVLARKPVVNQPGEGEIKKTASGVTHKLTSPLPGSIFKVLVNVGDSVNEGDCLLTMEAMKMENNVMADKAGVIQAIKVKVGDTVLQGDTLVEIA